MPDKQSRSSEPRLQHAFSIAEQVKLKSDPDAMEDNNLHAMEPSTSQPTVLGTTGARATSPDFLHQLLAGSDQDEPVIFDEAVLDFQKTVDKKVWLLSRMTTELL